jgi:hypothetical protein
VQVRVEVDHVAEGLKRRKGKQYRRRVRGREIRVEVSGAMHAVKPGEGVELAVRGSS